MYINITKGNVLIIHATKETELNPNIKHTAQQYLAEEM